MAKEKNRNLLLDPLKMEQTLNNMGYMFKDLTDYCRAFINFSETSGGPVLEIGAAFGFVSLKVASKGVQIWSNDLELRHLEQLQKKASKRQKSFINIKAAKFPEELEFPDNFFTGIFSSNVFHFIKPQAVSQGVRKMFSWVKPGGKVFITAGTPYANLWKEYIPILEEKMKKGEKWPGYTEDFSIFTSNRRLKDLPNFWHFFTSESLSSIFEEAGFIIEKKGYSSRKNWPEDLQLDGRETAGLIAKKPFLVREEDGNND